MEDADEILECYQRIQRLLERFSVSSLKMSIDAVLTSLKLNANVNIWKTVDEQATASVCFSDEYLADGLHV